MGRPIKVQVAAGDVFGRWTVLSILSKDDPRKPASTRYAEVRCECGQIGICAVANMLSGASKSCGCLAAEKLHERADDLSTRVFGQLKPIRKVSTKPVVWLCVCTCGNEIEVPAGRLTSDNKAHCGCAHRGQKAESGFNDLLRNYKAGAKNRSYLWALTDAEFTRLIAGDCFYCGAPPSRLRNKGKKGEIQYNGIDRKYNDIGYTYSNSVSCCWMCNQMKLDNTTEDFINHCRKVTERTRDIDEERFYEEIQMAQMDET